MLGFLVGLIVVGSFSWYCVFNEAAREKFFHKRRFFFRETEESKKFDMDMGLATSLIVAVFCSTILAAIAIIALLSLFR